MIKYARIAALLLGTPLITGCGAVAYGTGLAYVATATPTGRDLSVRDTPRVAFVDDVRISFGVSNGSGCLGNYGFPNSDQFTCSVVSFSPPAARSFEERIRLAQRAIEENPDLRWIISDRSEIVRVTRQLRPERVVETSLWLAYGIR